jgi:hypothetical protein
MRIEFKGKMGKIMSLLVIFSLLGLSGNLMAGERRGATLVVQKKVGVQEKGELIAVKQNSILLLGSYSGADISIDVPDIKTIKIVKGSGALPGLAYGFLIGGAVGAAIGLASGDDAPHFVRFTAGQKALIAGAVLGAAGGVIGLIVGGSTGNEQTIQIEGKSEPEVQSALRALKLKARMPDYH